jgi:hypothetical protein
MTLYRTVAILLPLLVAAHLLYSLTHELAHYAVIEALGGQVTGIHIDPGLGDSYVMHISNLDTTGWVLVNIAGLAMTSILAIGLAVLSARRVGLVLPALLFTIRSIIYAADYMPGTDISAIRAAAGIEVAFGLTVAIVTVNLGCLAYMVNVKMPIPRHIFRVTV